MKRVSLTLFLTFFSMVTFAVDCQFVPQVTKAGAYGYDGNLLVCSDAAAGTCYNLGLATDDQAKNRYSTALTALVSEKSIRLRFPSEATCAVGTLATVPSELILFK